MTWPGPSRTSASRRPGCAPGCRDLSGPVPVPSERRPLPPGRLGRRRHARPAGDLAGAGHRPSAGPGPGARPGRPGPGLPRPVVCRAGSRQRGSGRGRAVSAGALRWPPPPWRAPRLLLRGATWPGYFVATEPVRATGLLGVGGRPGIFNWRAIEADALIGLGRLDDAETALDEFEAAIPGGGLASAALALGSLPGQPGRGQRAMRPQAEAAFTRAHSLEPTVPMPFEHALVSLDDGRRLCGPRTAGGRRAARDGRTASSPTWGQTPTCRPAPRNWPPCRSRPRPRAPPPFSGSAAPSWRSPGWSPPG